LRPYPIRAPTPGWGISSIFPLAFFIFWLHKKSPGQLSGNLPPLMRQNRKTRYQLWRKIHLAVDADNFSIVAHT
jgi:hypothetical protein